MTVKKIIILANMTQEKRKEDRIMIMIEFKNAEINWKDKLKEIIIKENEYCKFLDKKLKFFCNCNIN